ncbi:hypothetical protein ACVWW6_008795 [Bradyrhizobium sp. USDA 3311]
MEFYDSEHVGGLVAPTWFCSKIGGLRPNAPWGRSYLEYLHQVSTFSWAAARLSNEWVLRHSARKRPSRTSMNALSFGLPSCEKSSVTPRW